jgi:hypothetical protein
MKGRIYTTIPSVVRNLGKQVKFLQPLYEAVSNSLEANATEIAVTLHKNDPQFMLEGVSDDRVTGFSIMDNGDGFTEKNREAFCELWTDNKLSLGCKGSGRFTWLSVFNNIQIESEIVSEGKRITIPFSLGFNEEYITIEQKSDITNNRTTITFTDISSDFEKERIVDRDKLEKVFESVKEYLLVKLFLLKKDGKQFRIAFRLDDELHTLTTDDIPDLESKTFAIPSDLHTPPKEYSFTLYYHFFEDNKNSKKGYYCANDRAAQAMDSDELGFSASLPNKDSFRMLLCSDYFDDKDSDSRNGLVELSGKKDRNLDTPLLFSDIKPRTIREMQEIIKARYPEIEKLNKRAIKNAIAKKPYLASIIRENDEIVKTVDSLLKDANIKFMKKKETVQAKFNSILKKQNVGEKELLSSVNEVSDVALAELGEYIQYRNSIIIALRKGVEDDSKKEDFFHNIIMPQRTTDASGSDRHWLSNLWLLDDKFMTYSYAASDTTVKKIIDDIETKNAEHYKTSNRPDLSIFFNKMNGNKDLIMLELKGSHAEKNEKNKSITELPNNIGIIRRNIPDVCRVWGYIITTVDDDFAATVEMQDFKKLFAIDEENKLYYRYYDNLQAHIFVLDFNTLISDALARNKTFLDILKGEVEQ